MGGDVGVGMASWFMRFAEPERAAQVLGEMFLGVHLNRHTGKFNLHYTDGTLSPEQAADTLRTILSIVTGGTDAAVN